MKKILVLFLAVLLFAACGDDPEAEKAQGALGGVCYPNGTCDSGLSCDEMKNICTKTGDISDSGDTQSDTGDSAADTGDTQSDTGDPDTGNPDTGNTESDTGDTQSDTGDTGNVPETCGNGQKDEGEICEKTETVACSAIDPEYVNGMAKCIETCNGWITDDCSDTSVAPLASIPARYHELTYLYSGADAFKEGANQEDETWTAPLFTTSIDVQGETYAIPHTQANVHWISAYYDSSALYFFQDSYACDENYENCVLTMPEVMFGAALSDLSAGNELKMGISDEKYKVNFLINDMMNDSDCVMLVGYGKLTVDAVNISAGSAGNFKFTTSKIGLYLPVSTPEGDVSSDLKNAGFKVCQ